MRRALSVESILGPRGALAGVLAGYEHRSEQLAMARAVEEAFLEHAYLVAEAGTGTGKTLAYLVPAVLCGRKVVVSTATKTLQEQIFLKDVPLLRERVGLEFTAAVLKGRNNYLCGFRFEEFDRSPAFPSRAEARAYSGLKQWALTTQTGDRAEADLPEAFQSWSRLSSTRETCLGGRCPYYEGCFVTRARRRAEEADLVVVNHHLFFADLSLRSRAGEGVLPAYQAAVFDEAHALEEVATEFFGLQISTFRLEELCRDAEAALLSEGPRRKTVEDMAASLRQRAQAFFAAAHRELGLSGEPVRRMTPGSLGAVSGESQELAESLKVLSAFGSNAPEPALAAVSRRAEEISSELERISRASSPDHVYWAEARGRGTFLRAAPIEIARELRERLYQFLDTAVFTSATLTASGRFDFFAERLGLSGAERPLRTLSVDSPFDFARQAALYLPDHLPEPRDPGFSQAAADELVQLALLSQGRAFALFTSLRQMEAVHQLTRLRLPFQVLLQGERPKSALLEAFRAEPSVLFASHSFWEGVDVPGDALSLVVIDKLPFASPSDPLVAARIERLRQQGADPFATYQLPRAAILLRQGFGRLIRTRQDRGVVAVLDNRLARRGYGRTFLDSLPRAQRVRTLAELERWWSAGGERER